MTAHLGLIAAVRDRLCELADPDKAGPMRAYMKSELPFHGVQAGPRRRAMDEIFAAYPLDDAAAWGDTVRTLWRAATHREERYAAVQLTGHPRYLDFQGTAAVGLYEDLIVAGAWWDYVDEIAVRRIGPLLREDPERMRPLVRGWALSGDLWLRRTAIICQNGAGARTDPGLLFGVIEPNLDHQGFFIRKAIGWALRSYARVEPDAVARFVADTGQRMSPLSRREALKHLRVPENGHGARALV
ncbi:3-methyladenine DNA glycosylase AlkD [Nocardiopsis mwathae]|uniref:3-methyladenine DNA glycosylase AlkD n=1 Tax=Nocardiopsis mwathae TaxID=1472723 RepID=A0A7X0D7E1_9ACTN|nr:DNA alkylation repair protein [Nocardiopsis mwathae]MBB6172924.1 3-methyladenine DNA glycosylase AlkD [Nocardiopsis mwathae]